MVIPWSYRGHTVVTPWSYRGHTVVTPVVDFHVHLSSLTNLCCCSSFPVFFLFSFFFRNTNHPNHLSCTSDEQCRTRSNSTATKESGLSSACDANHPEDCARCVFNASSTQGTCECVGGGPRCGLCRLASDGYKGYFRLNDECQECPDDPWLLLILMALAIVVFCVVGWWMQDKKINVAFLSIGVDYFQVLGLFARIRIRWPDWMRDILQVLSIFNFNIGKTWCFVVVLLWRVLGGSSDLV